MDASLTTWRLRAIQCMACCILYQNAGAAIVDIQPREIPFGHTTDLTVTHDAPVSLLVTGATAPAAIIATTSAALAATLLLDDALLLLTEQSELVICDLNGTPKSSLQLPAGMNRGLISWEGLVVAYGASGIGLLEPVANGFSLARQESSTDMAWLRAGNRQLIGISSHQQLVTLELDADGTLHQTGSAAVAETVRDIAVDGNFAYLAVGDAGIVVFQLAAAEGLKIVARYRSGGSANGLVINNAILYIADGANGLSIVDISDPTTLRQLGSHNKLGSTSRVRMDAMGLLLLNSDYQLHLVDASDAWQPRLIGSHDLSAGPAISSMQFTRNLAYVARGNALTQVDFSNASVPMISSEGVNQGGSRRAWIEGDSLYVADWFSGLHIYDISKPNYLRQLGNFHTAGSAKGVLVHGNVAYVGDDDHGLQIIDISKASDTHRLTEVATGGLAYTMKREDTLLYVADHRGGFHIVDISDPAHAHKLGSYDTQGKAWAIAVREKTAFVADDNAGILSFDITTPEQPLPIGAFDPKGQAEDIVIRDNIAICAFFDRGLYLLDISDPANMREISHIPIPGNARGIAVAGDLIYLAAWDAGLQVVDISYLTDPKIIGRLDTDGSTWGVNIKGKYAYLLDWWGGIKVADVSNPKAPRLVSRYHARAPIEQVHIKGKYAYLASGEAGVQVFDIKNPLNPIWVTAMDLPGQVRDVLVSDDLLYALNANGHLDILDVSDPFTLKLLPHAAVPKDTVAITGGLRFLALLDAHHNVYVRDLANPLQPGAPQLLHRGVNAMQVLNEHLILGTDTGLVAYSHADFKSPPATLITAQPVLQVHGNQDTIVAALAGDGLHWYRWEHASLVDGELSLAFTQTINQLQLHDNQLLVATENALYTFTLSTDNTPTTHNYYPTRQRLTGFDMQGTNVFFAGGPTLSSITLLPPTRVTPIDDHHTRITFPGAMPLGRYQIRSLDNPDADTPALAVTLVRPKQPRLSNEMFKRMMPSGPGQ